VLVYIEQGGRLTSLVAVPTIKQLEDWLSQKEIVVKNILEALQSIKQNSVDVVA
jgi:hypothetical protein